MHPLQMTRLEAIRLVRAGKTLTKAFLCSQYGIEDDLIVSIEHHNVKSIARSLGYENVPLLGKPPPTAVNMRFCSGGGRAHRISISAKQLLGFIKRNYLR